jgi:hypothetical protein
VPDSEEGAPVPEPVESNNELEYDVYAGNALVYMVKIVAVRKELEEVPKRFWEEAVVEKLNSVGIHTLKDLKMAVVGLNRRLGVARHPRLHELTINLMMEVVAEMVLPAEDE